MPRKSNVSGAEEGLASTNKLLGVIVALLLRQGQDGSPSLKQQIEILNDLGMRPSEIASILGRSGTHINKELTGIRKGRKKG